MEQEPREIGKRHEKAFRSDGMILSLDWGCRFQGFMRLSKPIALTQLGLRTLLFVNYTSIDCLRGCEKMHQHTFLGRV